MSRAHHGLLLLACLAANPAGAAGAPAVKELRTQRVGDVIYFHVRFDTPADMRQGPPVEQATPSAAQRWKLTRLAQLVPQDNRTRAVYLWLNIPDYQPAVGFEKPHPPVSTWPLEFVGKLSDLGKVRLRLLYPTVDKMPAPPAVPDGDARVSAKPPAGWVECDVELDFAKAERLPPRDSATRRKLQESPLRDDLEGLWALGQAARFAVLEALTPEFGFYGFACEATGRRYGVRAPMLDHERRLRDDRDRSHRQLYETTTGAAAITESLQLHRMLNTNNRDRGERTLELQSVSGIEIGEHPWEKMMAGKKPSLEPLARLVPHDNYYVHFKSIRKFIECGELMDEWGSNLTRAYEVNSRDYDLRGRYERQLCLRSTWAGKTLGPAVVRSLAVTGSDAYLREGSDLTILFHVSSRPLFLNAVAPFLDEARRAFGSRLREVKEDYHGVAVESFVTPLREVSLHRATLGDVIIYSNSPAGLRRVIDVQQGRRKALADSLDFQYMRTVYRLEDELEDGFAFLSDPFIRQLVGPASKIKEKRRLEAMTSLQMVTNAALFTAWETGKPPADHAALLAASALKPAEIYVPEGKGVVWDGKQQAAVSDVYNTVHFPTPLIELPIDKITSAEQQEYMNFRQEYLNLWRKFFDPVGMRISLNDKRVRLETYILPLIRSSDYEQWRMISGDGTSKLDSSRFTPQTLAQITVHASNQGRSLVDAFILQSMGKMGDWAMIRLDDTRGLAKVVEQWVQYSMNPKESPTPWMGQLFQYLPFTAGIPIQEPKELSKFAEAIARSDHFFPGAVASREMSKPYKGTPITRVKLQNPPETCYYTLVDGAWYIGTNEAALRHTIDHAAVRLRGKDDLADINASVYLAPQAFQKSRPALGYFLEWEGHRRTLINNPAWYPLYHCGLLKEGTPEKSRQEVARRYLGFVPVSPDGAAYAYDAKADEVVNRRHGSLRKPQWHPALDDKGLLARLLDEIRTVRADLRFREDGVNTTVTIERKGK